tara:strand:- start:517 stop:1059 length:543 start_codon:yes stop_codon:yes gene_type:complete
MPLSNNILNAGLSRFMDPDSSSFKSMIDGKIGSFPKDGEELGEFWSKAITAYVATLAPPPANTVAWLAGLEAMRRALAIALRPAVVPDPTNLIYEQTFNSAFTAYGTALGLLILASSPGIYSISTPPAGALGTQLKATVFPVGLAGGKASEVVEENVKVISAWFKTGTVTTTAGAITKWT